MSESDRREAEEREAESVFAPPDRSQETLAFGEHPGFDRSRETLASGSHPRFDQQREAPERDPRERLASEVGNRAFGVLIAREGAGILRDGTVHPDVQATIASRRGGGGALDAGTRGRFAPSLGDSLSDVRVHTDAGADALARSVSARAFTTGSDVFFASGEYRPGSGDGDRLLAHELTHVVQQRGAPTSGPLTVSEPGDAQETEADAVARELTG